MLCLLVCPDVQHWDCFACMPLYVMRCSCCTACRKACLSHCMPPRCISCRQAPRQQRAELIAALTACSGSQQRNTSSSGGGTGDDATCHIEVVEYCDLGNLTSAIRSQIFNLPPPGQPGPGSRHAHSRHASRSSHRSGYESGGGYDSSTDGEGSFAGDASLGSPGSLGGHVSGGNALPPGRLRVNMRWLLLTLLEVAEGMAYLHRMGVVHCDVKPANVRPEGRQGVLPRVLALVCRRSGVHCLARCAVQALFGLLQCFRQHCHYSIHAWLAWLAHTYAHAAARVCITAGAAEEQQRGHPRLHGQGERLWAEPRGGR